MSGYRSGVGTGKKNQREGFRKLLKLLTLGICQGCSVLNSRSAGDVLATCADSAGPALGNETRRRA